MPGLTSDTQVSGVATVHEKRVDLGGTQGRRRQTAQFCDDTLGLVTQYPGGTIDGQEAEALFYSPDIRDTRRSNSEDASEPGVEERSEEDDNRDASAETQKTRGDEGRESETQPREETLPKAGTQNHRTHHVPGLRGMCLLL
ncbi:hypothetical protein NDU88_002920 [Pleurodeles waltl]|uniref:Uncharacterized protein n=1 Tax=Pleurodeles waltl TaxID=8319 RepID=A0AAV7W0P2_PLEWA|nr:hypothetical protein NDU88_002920 [Pleurodeles waltl]